MDARFVDLSESTPRDGVLETSMTLAQPQKHLHVRLPRGQAGRAEAVFDGGRWAAKHYWQEAPGVTIYEFDEPLPAGPVRLRIPFVIA